MTNIVTLKNGIRVVIQQLSYLRTASFSVWIKVESVNETRENNGISHMIEHMLFKGTKTRTTKDIANQIAFIGDDVNAFTGKEVTCYYGATTTQQLPLLVDLLSDMIQNSTFTKEDIRKEKRIICEEIDMYDDSADDMVHELLQKRIYKDQSLGYIISGTKTNVRSFTRQQILDYMSLYYTADRMLISIAGNVEETSFLELLEEKFGDIKGQSVKEWNAKNYFNQMKKSLVTASPYEKKYSKPEKFTYYPCFIARHKDNEQLHINIAYPSISLTSKESVIFTIFNSILGGSNNSRLFQRIREDLSLVYSIYSYGSFFEYNGLFHIDITVGQAQAIKVLKETKEEIDKLVSTGIGEEELETHKSQVRTELIMSYESSKARMDSNAKGILLRGYLKTPEELLEEIELVTVDKIHEFAIKTLNTINPSMCVIGSEEQTRFATIKKEFEQNWQNLV